MEYLTIKEMPEEARPRERLESSGPDVLSNQELLAITISTGVVTGKTKYTAIDLAMNLLKEFDSLKGVAQADFKQLIDVSGIGPAKACQIMAAFELGKRVAMFSHNNKPVVRQPTDVFDYFRDEMSLLPNEIFRVVALDTKNRILKDKIISEGTLNASIVHPRDVFRFALIQTAANIILLHNHPSGDPTPSKEDVQITKRLIEVGRVMDVPVLDHLVIASGKFLSMKEMGIM
jgi:DNA repair protein RadC